MMLRKNSFLAACVCAAIMALGVAVALPQANDLGVFTNQGGVGQTPAGCKAVYDAAKGEYRITGGGANMWTAIFSGWAQARPSIARPCLSFDRALILARLTQTPSPTATG
jgi:hypothetical protein